MNTTRSEHSTEPCETETDRQDTEPNADTPEHMKPDSLEKLRDYGKDSIPPGVA